MEKQIESESRLTFLEATGVIIGHGVGSGILAVPFLASQNNIWHFIIICIVAFFMNWLLHIMIAELSYNNGGAQFVKCFEIELFKGKVGKILTYFAFGCLALSVIMNCCSYITGSALAIEGLFGGLNHYLAVCIYFVFAALVVFFGMKIVGICEKYCAFAMAAVVIILTVAVFTKELNPLPVDFVHIRNVMALYGMVSFALSSVMSVPTVVKGVNGDRKKVLGSITLGIGVNIGLVVILALVTLLGVGNQITDEGAINDLSKVLGGWVGVVGYLFTILALSTSFWANTLSLRDTIHEQIEKLDLKLCWLIASVPCLLIVLIFGQSFTKLAMLASVIQILTGLGIIVAYGISRKKTMKAALEAYGNPLEAPKYLGSPICGFWGILPFQIAVIISSLVATLGSALGPIS